jgi:hypothetical protein
MMSAVRAFADGPMTGEQVDQVLLDFRHTSQAALAQARADLEIA